MKFDRKKKTSLASIAPPKPPDLIAKEESLAGIADSFRRDFCDWMETEYTRSSDHRSPGLHASQLWKLCGRRTILESLMGVDRVEEQESAGGFQTQDEGTALHEWWQNVYLPGWGKLYGRWKCLRCDKVYGTNDTPILRPDECFGSKTCVKKPSRFEYKEVRINIEEYDIVGSVDALLLYKGEELVGEIKTKSVSQFKGLHYPEFKHIIQGHAYMAGTGRRRMVFIYLQKGKLATWTKPGGVWRCTGTTMKTFIVPFDDKLWAKVLKLSVEDAKARSVVMEEGLYEPDALLNDHLDIVDDFSLACGSKTCELAKECAVRDKCFELHEDADEV